MPRRKAILDNPDDPGMILQYIEARAKQGQGDALDALLRDQTRPVLRAANLRNTKSSFKVSSYDQRVAAACHLRGEIRAVVCKSCRTGSGPFAECIYLSGFNDLTKMRCANCLFSGKTVSARHGKVVQICNFAEDRPYRSREYRPTLFAQRSPIYSRPGYQSLAIKSSSNTSPPRADKLENRVIHILGGLSLTQPPKDELYEGFEELLDRILPHLEKLSRREMSTIKKTITDISSAFEEFKCNESQCWIESGTFPPPPTKYLVKPSGSLKSPISHRLNQPSFDSSLLEHGETADPTSGCISMVMGTAFIRGESLIYDQLHRRAHFSEGLKEYPDQVLQCHEDMTNRISESLEAKVEVVYGKFVQQRILTDSKIQKTLLPLWEEFSGVVLLIIHESNFRNAEEGYIFRKVLVLARHPQWLYFQPLGSGGAIRQDEALSAAALMAGPAISHIQDYYAKAVWRKSQPSLKDRVEHAAFGNIIRNDRLFWPRQSQNKLNPLSAVSEGEHCWEQYFREKPYSNKELRQLLPSAIEATACIAEDCSIPSLFPQAVLKWWQGQKQILFHSATVFRAKDVFRILKTCNTPMRSSINPPTHER